MYILYRTCSDSVYSVSKLVTISLHICFSYAPPGRNPWSRCFRYRQQQPRKGSVLGARLPFHPLLHYNKAIRVCDWLSVVDIWMHGLLGDGFFFPTTWYLYSHINFPFHRDWASVWPLFTGDMCIHMFKDRRLLDSSGVTLQTAIHFPERNVGIFNCHSRVFI